MSFPELTLDGLTSEPGTKIVRCQSRMRFTVYPHADDPVFKDRSTDARRIVLPGGPGGEADFSLRQFSWSKMLGQAAGQWQALIRTDPRISTFDPMKGDLLPGDWVEIELLRNGLAIPVCLGIVNTVTRDRRSVGGATSIHWQLSGTDHGGVFDRPITYSNIYAQTLDEVVTGLMTRRVRGKIGGSPAEMFAILIEAAFTHGSKSSTWKLPPSLAQARGFAIPNASILTIMEIISSFPTQGAYYNEVQLWNKAGQSLHQALEFWCFPLMHQMTYDVSDPSRDNLKSGSPITAVIRERPYIDLNQGLDGEWFKLPTWKVPNWLPASDSLARSDHERFNIIQLLSNVAWEGSAGEQTVTCQPQYSKKSVEKYGLRPCTPSTHFTAAGQPSIDASRALRSNLQDVLAMWHAPNPYFLSGHINLPIPIPEARIGHRLQLDSGTESEMLTFFIEGARMDFEASSSPEDPPRARSSFTVTRGYKGSDDDGLDLVQKSIDQYENLK